VWHLKEDQTEFPLGDADHRAAKELLSNLSRPLIGLHPAAADAYKCWPPDLFAAVGKALQQTYGGTLLVLGNQDSWALAQSIVDEVGERAVNLSGHTALPILGATIARLSILVSNDSGPAHIAYALHIPSVTLFRQTDPVIWGPLPTNPSLSCHRVVTPDFADQVSDFATLPNTIFSTTVIQAAKQAMECSSKCATIVEASSNVDNSSTQSG
jgi:ADP-heptose:LPS heptosyltransferase